MIRRKMKFGLAEVFRVGGVCGLFFAADGVLKSLIEAAALPAGITGAAVLGAFTTPVLIGIGIGLACMFIASTIKTRSEQAEKEQEHEVKQALAQGRGVALAPAVEMQPARAADTMPASDKSFVQDYITEKANPLTGRQV